MHRLSAPDSPRKHQRETDDDWLREFGPDPHLEEQAEKYRDQHAQRPEDARD